MSVLSRLAVASALLDLNVKRIFRDLLAVGTVAATGSASTDAAGLTTGRNVVTASDGTKGVILPRGTVDMAVTVVNTVAGSNLLVYPAASEQINALTVTTGAFTVPGGNEATFYCDAGAHWYVAAGGTEAFDDLTVTNPIIYSNATGITAFAGGGQASATALTEENNNVTTCATASDSVKLPAAAAGKKITVRNSGAAACAVFPATGDAIASLAANLSVDIGAKGQMTFSAIDATTWHIAEFLISQAPSTQKGSLVVKAADSAGNTVTTITNASQAAARTYTIPDAGADASFVQTEGTQTVNGAKTFSGTVTLETVATAVEAAEHGAGAIGTSSFGAPKTYRWTDKGVIVTQIKFDLTGLASVATGDDVIGLAAGGAAYIGRNVVATNGVIFKAELSCLETPTTGDNDVNVVTSSNAALAYDSAGGTAYISNSGDLLAGQAIQNLVPALTANDYFYLTAGTGDTAGTYASGMYVLTLYGHALLA